MLAQFALPIIGGEEQHVINLSRELVRRGHQVAIATIKHSNLPEYEIVDGVRIYRLNGSTQRISRLYKEENRRHAPPFPDPEITLGIRRVILKEQPDVVHAHNWIMYSYLPLKSRSKAGLVMTLHDYSLQCATKRFMHRGQTCSGPGVRKCLVCACAHYGVIKGGPIYLSNQVMSHWERKSVDMFLAVSRVTAINNGLVDSGLPYQIIPNFISDDPQGEQDNQNTLLDQLPKDGYLLFVGDISYEKGIMILLRAYAGLKNAPPLVLIGRSGTDTPKELPPNVLMLGSWPHSAVMQAWKRSGIALVPSVWSEPFGMVVIEAMSAGRPVIASQIGGILDIITHGDSGLLVTPGDSESLQKAIELLLKNPEMREQMGKAAERRSVEFRASTVVPRIEQIYRSIIHGNSVDRDIRKVMV
jgi:glycosyltransferase involved in cell wall biosynthesis